MSSSRGFQEDRTMPCCWAHHHCCWYPPPVIETGRRLRWRRGVRDEDLEDLEEERDMLEARLRRLERELAELRRAQPGPAREG
jgi:hypothetical protein